MVVLLQGRKHLVTDTPKVRSHRLVCYFRVSNVTINQKLPDTCSRVKNFRKKLLSF